MPFRAHTPTMSLAPAPQTSLSFESHGDLMIRLPIADTQWLDARLAMPAGVTGVVLFAHGGASGRHSARTRVVADRLNASGLGTLLIDLLSADEEAADRQTGALRFDIPLLAARLGAVTDLLAGRQELRHLRFGYFAASTGAAAALVAAGARRDRIAAIVCRGGRLDLAESALQQVGAPTLLIVGDRDAEVMALNRAALRRNPRVARLRTVPGATHLFEEPGALTMVARLTHEWFGRHFAT